MELPVCGPDGLIDFSLPFLRRKKLFVLPPNRLFESWHRQGARGVSGRWGMTEAALSWQMAMGMKCHNYRQHHLSTTISAALDAVRHTDGPAIRYMFRWLRYVCPITKPRVISLLTALLFITLEPARVSHSCAIHVLSDVMPCRKTPGQHRKSQSLGLGPTFRGLNLAPSLGRGCCAGAGGLCRRSTRQPGQHHLS
jgi:hypothetical protein